MSKTAQNKLLLCIKKYIRNNNFSQVKCEEGFYGIEADEVTDVSNLEHLALVIRYFYNIEIIERLVLDARHVTKSCRHYQT